MQRRSLASASAHFVGVLLVAACAGNPPDPHPMEGGVAGIASDQGGGGSPATAGAGSGSLSGSPSAGTASNAGAGAGATNGGQGGTTTGGTNAGSDNVGGGGSGSPVAGAGPSGGTTAGDYVPIAFGTKLDPAEQIVESQAFAHALANPSAANWRAKGDQLRTYRFEEANADVEYRVCVPNHWDGTSPLPLVMFLHGAGNDESSYLDQNGRQMVELADEHGYVLVSPLGHGGAYGNFLRLPADFSRPGEAEALLAMRTAQTERAQELSEKDVINVLEMVLSEYPIDRDAMFLMGHSMGSGGTWYIGAKYSSYWSALAPMSGPFVLESGYPWQNLSDTPVFVTEGLGAATVQGSHAVRDWMEAQGYPVTYAEVNADHGGMVPLVLPAIFDFFDANR